MTEEVNIDSPTPDKSDMSPPKVLIHQASESDKSELNGSVEIRNDDERNKTPEQNALAIDEVTSENVAASPETGEACDKEEKTEEHAIVSGDQIKEEQNDDKSTSDENTSIQADPHQLVNKKDDEMEGTENIITSQETPTESQIFSMANKTTKDEEITDSDNGNSNTETTEAKKIPQTPEPQVALIEKSQVENTANKEIPNNDSKNIESLQEEAQPETLEQNDDIEASEQRNVCDNDSDDSQSHIEQNGSSLEESNKDIKETEINSANTDIKDKELLASHEEMNAVEESAGKIETTKTTHQVSETHESLDVELYRSMINANETEARLCESALSDAGKDKTGEKNLEEERKTLPEITNTREGPLLNSDVVSISSVDETNGVENHADGYDASVSGNEEEAPEKIIHADQSPVAEHNEKSSSTVLESEKEQTYEYSEKELTMDIEDNAEKLSDFRKVPTPTTPTNVNRDSYIEESTNISQDFKLLQTLAPPSGIESEGSPTPTRSSPHRVHFSDMRLSEDSENDSDVVVLANSDELAKPSEEGISCGGKNGQETPTAKTPEPSIIKIIDLDDTEQELRSVQNIEGGTTQDAEVRSATPDMNTEDRLLRLRREKELEVEQLQSKIRDMNDQINRLEEEKEAQSQKTTDMSLKILRMTNDNKKNVDAINDRDQTIQTLRDENNKYKASLAELQAQQRNGGTKSVEPPAPKKSSVCVIL